MYQKAISAQMKSFGGSGSPSCLEAVVLASSLCLVHVLLREHYSTVDHQYRVTSRTVKP